jgi:probable rRNA maturation factor
MEYAEIEFLDVEENKKYIELIEKVVKKCFEVENLFQKNLYMNIILTTPANIRKANNEYRKIDKETDVLSFPMFEKDEIEKIDGMHKEALGDCIISLERVGEQAIEYGHSFERELSYMVVHSFYHLMGYDHMNDTEKKVMREKEEFVLNLLDITRD